jgi:hypothetical protein
MSFFLFYFVYFLVQKNTHAIGWQRWAGLGCILSNPAVVLFFIFIYIPALGRQGPRIFFFFKSYLSPFLFSV